MVSGFRGSGMNSNRMPSELNNKGLSLVELIVAISIGVIVSGSIAALLVFAIRTYRNESVNTSMQYELQTNLNMMMDEIMGAQSLVVVQNKSSDVTAGNALYTKYALFGKFVDDGSKYKFSGVIFASSSKGPDGKYKIYMDRLNAVEGDSPIKIAQGCYSTVTTGGTQYLLGENATQFVIEPLSLDDSKKEYTNPISVKVELQFERNGWGSKEYKRHINDIAYLRNRVTDITSAARTTDSVYVNKIGTHDVESDYTSYKLQKKGD